MKHCLIIDDSEIIRRVAAVLLSDMGFLTSEAENGQHALEKCVGHMPDVILLDWHMPVMSGIEFVSSLRLQEGGDIPHVIYCTTENDPQDLARAYTAGANDFLIKPFDRASLFDKVIAIKQAA